MTNTAQITNYWWKCNWKEACYM